MALIMERKLLESCLCPERKDHHLKSWGGGGGSALQRAALGSESRAGGKERGGDRVAWAWAGWEQPLCQKQRPGRLARTCKGDNRARTTGCLGALAGGPSRCVSPAAAPAAGGPPSPAPPRWPTGSPAPGPRREHQGSCRDGAGGVEGAVCQTGCAASYCVASGRWLCLSQP